jgi:hypothetical protein
VLKNPSKRVIQALAALESDPDFKEVLAWLEESRNTFMLDGFYTKDEVQSRWFQGAGQAVTEFLDKAQLARETLRKF